MNLNNNPTTATITITRRCNLNCPYCNIPNSNTKELSLQQWKKALDIIANLGIKRLTFIGGEPTIYPQILDCIDYAVNNKTIDTSIITNALRSYNIIKNCIELGVKKISCSLDTMDINNSISPVKSKNAISLIEQLEKQNLLQDISMRVYTVLSKRNIDDVYNFVKEMSAKNISVYFIPYHWGQEKHYEHRKNENALAFTSKNDIKKLSEIINDLIKLKEDGLLIANSTQYLKNITKHIEYLDWHCSSLSELRIDADGSMMCCCDKKGKVNKKYKIFDLENNNVYNQFLKDRELDRLKCNGCLWPSSFEAELLKQES